MTMVTALSEDQIRLSLEQLDGWQYSDNKLHKEYRFKDFKQAFDFIAQVAEIAEAINHHPQWSNIYNLVTIDLYHHEKDAVTQLDIELALKIERLLEQV